jgi:hypothetical protein
MVEKSKKVKVTNEFIGPDGQKTIRSKMGDFLTLQTRIFIRLQKAAPKSERILMHGINSYNEANYGSAINSFILTVNKFPILKEELRPHIVICRRVLKTLFSTHDIDYEKYMSKWNNTPLFFRIIKAKPVHKIRCKYCGHYTLPIAPEYGFAYLGTNNCDICGRGYPTPDFAWDGIDGQAYIYYRNSVKEEEFYKEFERMYDVYPDHKYFLKQR